MNQLLTVFNGSTIFSKIDLHGAYNLMRIKEGDEHLTAFRTKYGSYEYLVMQLGLTNSPASLHNLVDDIFADFLDIFVVFYLDYIMVFSSLEEEHVKHLASVLQRPRDNSLFSKASNCVFHESSVEYLGYVVPSDGLKIDSSKAQQIINLPQPKNIKALPSFCSFTNFHCCFIKNYSKIISALTSLLKKDSPFIFNDKAFSQFQILKEALTTAPILSHFNPSLPTIVETDASDYASGTVLSQVLATLPDALSCWDNMYPERGVDLISKNTQNFHQVLKLNEIKESEIFSDLVYRIQKAVWKDKEYKEIIKQLARGESVSDYSLEPQVKLLLFKDIVVIPRSHKLQLDILQKLHESLLAGHPGQENTLKLIKRDFYWAGMNQINKDYVSSCQQCSRNNKIHHKKVGLLKPLQILYGPWNSLSMDFITKLPLSRNFDTTLVVVERFSKMVIFIPAYSTITALYLAQMFIRHIFPKNCLPINIVSDRDGQTERVNQILEQYFQMYVSYHQDDWNTWLRLSEVDYNDAEHSPKKSPFFTIYGRNPIFDSIKISQDKPA
ncbi:hypothetical protein O181_052417 [Austropuccinia psidii MF-1]|uniref:Reverse transcriptase domain-containing protein n=1 Tax=Austropuccinia psidii MF-1 TaxID=1389203 RepID=A0A9Q3E7L3_9BASI|nr:hypothetical protein [Austropuccinia psidii MF-1]